MKKVLVVCGSPRKNSNTHLLVKESLKGLKDSGTNSEVVFLNDLNIKGCQACYHCKTHHVSECILQDDMGKMYKMIEESDGIIVASPIYFGGISAQTKTWLDRLFPYLDMNMGSLLKKGTKMSFIFTQNQPDPSLFQEHIATLKNMFGFLGFEVKESLLACNLDKDYKPMISENKEVMRQAYELGKHLLS